MKPLTLSSHLGERITFQNTEGHVIDNVVFHHSEEGFHFHAFDELHVEIFTSDSFDSKTEMLAFVDENYPGVTIRNQVEEVHEMFNGRSERISWA